MKPQRSVIDFAARRGWQVIQELDRPRNHILRQSFGAETDQRFGLAQIITIVPHNKRLDVLPK